MLPQIHAIQRNSATAQQRNTLNAFVSLLIFFLITPLLHAQCSYTAGSGCDIAYSSSTTISSDITWSGTICVGANITVSGAGTTLTITSGTNVSFAAGAQIIVEDDAELIIENAELYASGGSGMWKGIKGEPGCYIYITGSEILHADIAMHAKGQAGGISILDVTGGTCFGNNEIGIFLEGDADYFVHTIEDTKIAAPALVSPANAMEEALTFVIPFTFINADSTSIYFADSDYEALYTLANDDPKIYGPAVYIAQAILGIRVEDELIDEAEEKINLTPVANNTSFPNPANQTFTISGNLNQYKDLKIEIYNIHGYCILKSAFTFNQSVDISHLNTGIYFIKLMNADQVIFIENFQILK